MAVIRRKSIIDAGRGSQISDRAPTLHDELVVRAGRWLRGTCGCSAIATELRAFTGSGECPDAIGWRSNYSILVECKSSRSDFLADKGKPFRVNPSMGVGVYRFYLCPPGLILVDDLPELWGLLYVEGDRIKRVAGPVGNSWEHGENKQFIQSRNSDAEIAMLVSALRRQGS